MKIKYNLYEKCLAHFLIQIKQAADETAIISLTNMV